ncbi:hypothetical protein Cadr_000008876 [Camelus dromedarius]|uniref:Uncharacterized protein n=1 Tax=Camelus dromedarius TaxID=9838 RepID=A0A5N4DJ93_CAMDR|nr:hypothetical protein Cadr_000008876 [Camelus dromedarius]KAB1271208.1 hypothetical protein Cadr_000008876 [Camelus dromedarius]
MTSVKKAAVRVIFYHQTVDGRTFRELSYCSHVASGMMSTQERNGNRRHHGARWHQEELLTVRRGTS